MKLIIELKQQDADGLGGQILVELGMTRQECTFSRLINVGIHREGDPVKPGNPTTDFATDQNALAAPILNELADHGIRPTKVRVQGQNGLSRLPVIASARRNPVSDLMTSLQAFAQVLSADVPAPVVLPPLPKTEKDMLPSIDQTVSLGRQLNGNLWALKKFFGQRGSPALKKIMQDMQKDVKTATKEVDGILDEWFVEHPEEKRGDPGPKKQRPDALRKPDDVAPMLEHSIGIAQAMEKSAAALYQESRKIDSAAKVNGLLKGVAIKLVNLRKDVEDFLEAWEEDDTDLDEYGYSSWL
jgi:hypothetical protein